MGFVGVDSEGLLIWLQGYRINIIGQQIANERAHMSCLSTSISMRRSTVQLSGMETSRDSPPHTGQSLRFSCSNV
jgi:hypothetical protein